MDANENTNADIIDNQIGIGGMYVQDTMWILGIEYMLVKNVFVKSHIALFRSGEYLRLTPSEDIKGRRLHKETIDILVRADFFRKYINGR